MSKSKIYISVCDRCGAKAEETAEHSSIFYDWGYVWFAQINGPLYSKVKTIPKYFNDYNDLCPDCLKDLHSWFNKPKTGNF